MISPWTTRKNFSVPPHQELVDGLNSLSPTDEPEGGEEFPTPRGRSRVAAFDAIGAALVEAIPLRYIIPVADSENSGKPYKYMECKTVDGELVIVQVARHHVPYTGDPTGEDRWPSRPIMYITEPTSIKVDKLNIDDGIEDESEEGEDKIIRPTAVEVCVDQLPILWGELSEGWVPGEPSIMLNPVQEDLATPTGHDEEEVFLGYPSDSSPVDFCGYEQGDMVPYLLMHRLNEAGQPVEEDKFFMLLKNSVRFRTTPATLVVSGGSGGPPADFIYDVYDLNGGLIGEDMPVMFRRDPDIELAAGENGIAEVRADGGGTLITVDEVPLNIDCDEIGS